MSIITPLDVRDHFTTLDTTDNDPLLGRLITRVDALCAAFCGLPRNDDGIYTLELSAYTAYPLPLPKQPTALAHGFPWLENLTSAHIDEAWTYGAGSALTNPAHVQIDKPARVLWLSPAGVAAGWRWSHMPRANRIVIDAGFSATPDVDGRSTAPADLVALVATAVHHLWDRAQVEGRLTISVEGGSSTRAEDDAAILLPRAVRDGLVPYLFGVRPVERLAPLLTWGARGF